MDGAAIYLVALFIEQFGDVLGGYRTEEAILLADLDLCGDRLRFQLLGEGLGGTAIALGQGLLLFASRLELGHVGGGGDQSLVARNQEVATIPVLYFHDLAGRTQGFNVL